MNCQLVVEGEIPNPIRPTRHFYVYGRALIYFHSAEDGQRME